MGYTITKKATFYRMRSVYGRGGVLGGGSFLG